MQKCSQRGCDPSRDCKTILKKYLGIVSIVKPPVADYGFHLSEMTYGRDHAMLAQKSLSILGSFWPIFRGLFKGVFTHNKGSKF